MEDRFDIAMTKYNHLLKLVDPEMVPDYESWMDDLLEFEELTEELTEEVEYLVGNMEIEADQV